jgi:hypothetical protein
MTYNFDPDRWYDRQRALLDSRRASGQLDDEQFERELDDLEKRYDEMTTRLDNTFQLPAHNPPDDQD